jgi:hypothetical protein
MARYNEILVGRYNRFIQKLLGLKGGPPSPQLASEIAATFEVEQISVENRYLLSLDSFGLGVTNAGVAGQLSTIKFRNPVGSNVIAIFEKISASTTTPDDVDVQIGTDQTNGATVSPISTLNNLDSRSGRVSSLILSLSAGAAPPSMATIFRGTFSTPTYEFIVFDHQEVTLNPGRSIQLVSGTGNLNLKTTWKWRERLLEESERT